MVEYNKGVRMLVLGWLAQKSRTHDHPSHIAFVVHRHENNLNRPEPVGGCFGGVGGSGRVYRCSLFKMPLYDGSITKVGRRMNARKKAVPIGERIFSIRFPRFPILFYRRG